MTQQCFSLTANMSFLHLHSVETLTNGMSAITCRFSELNVSSPGRFTQRLEEFIFTCSSISAENFDPGMFVSSMWTVGTRTLFLLEELQRKVTTMRSKMEMWSRVGLRDRFLAEECLWELRESAMLRTSANLRRSFLSYATKWIEVLSSNLSPSIRLTVSGDLPPSLNPLCHPSQLVSSVASLMDEMIGWRSLELELEAHH